MFMAESIFVWIAHILWQGNKAEYHAYGNEWNSALRWMSHIFACDNHKCAFYSYITFSFPINFGIWMFVYGAVARAVGEWLLSNDINMAVFKRGILLIVFVVYSLYVSASLSLVGVSMGSFIIVCTILLFIFVFLYALSIKRMEGMSENMMSNKYIREIVEDNNTSHVQWGRALLAVIFTVPFGCIAIMEYMRSKLFRVRTTMFVYIEKWHIYNVIVRQM